MALQECGLNLNSVSKELQPHGTIDFPCAGYCAHLTKKQDNIIPWHWHEDIEVVYIEEGQLILKTPAKSFCLKKGDCMVINSNILHYASTIDQCTLHSLVFNIGLIVGKNDSVFAKKYIIPLISCQSFSNYLIARGENEKVIYYFKKAFEGIIEERAGFEFTVRESLSQICFFLYEQFAKEITIMDSNQSHDNLRIRKMLEYIHENFSNNIALGEIAKVVNIGERECLRCFQKTIQMSPIQYLLKYRIMQSAQMLSRNPSSSISEIGTFCGFDSPSNFAKMFKRFYDCTPREYRSL